MTPGFLLEAVVARYGLDSVESLIQKVLPEAPEPTVQSIRDAIDRAAESFHEKHGGRYGGRNDSFLVRRENVEAIIRSTLPGRAPLSGGDLSGEGFEGATEAPVEVREEFVDLLHREMKEDRRLAEILEKQRQRVKADRRWKKLRDELESIREAAEEEEWFGQSVDEGPRSNYLRYLQEIADRFEESAGMVALDVIPGQKDVGPDQEEDRRLIDSEQNGDNRRELQEVLDHRDALLLTGPPGSGKSFMVEQLLWKVAIEAGAGPIADEGFSEEQSPIPVYVTPGRGDIFERIGHALHVDGLGDQPFSEEWIRQALQRGILLVAVDDANRFSREEIRDLLDYRSSSQVVLSTRDSSRIPREEIQHYQVGPLTEQQAKAVLGPELGEEAEVFYYRTQEDERLRALASRPQTLLLLASARTKNSWIPDDRFGLYDRAFNARHGEENRSGDLTDERWFKRRALGALALRAVETGEAYSLSLPEARRSVTHALQLLNEKGYGVDSTSTKQTLEALRQKGHLFADGETLRFEHDRWLEFFAACELVEREEPLGNIVSEEARREIAFFAGAISTMESEERDQPEFWADFWEQVAALDPFWALICREQQDARYRHDRGPPTVGDLEEVRSDLPEPSDSEIRRAFATYAKVYQELRDRHFPRMKEVFPPHAKGRVGVLVERERREGGLPGRGYMHGFVEIDSETPRARLVDELEYTYTKGGETVPPSILSSSSDPARGTPPAVVALNRLKDALQKALNKDRLWEPDSLLQERAYFEAAALHRSNLNSKRAAVPTSFDLVELQKRLDQSSYRVSKGKLEFSDVGGTRRKVSYSDWTETLKKANRRGVLTQPLEPPFPPPWTVIPTCDGAPLTEGEIDALTEWSVVYYESLYRTLFKLIKKGFPTTKQWFRSFTDTFPVLVALVLGDREEGQVMRPKNTLSRARLGEVWNIQRRDSPEEEVEVVVLEGESEARRLAKEKGTTGVWRTGWSMKFRPNIPPLNHGVYREVRRDLEKLLRGRRYSL